jgi:hypothetical protein
MMARLGGGVGPVRHTKGTPKWPAGGPERHSRLVVDPDRLNSITCRQGNPFLPDPRPLPVDSAPAVRCRSGARDDIP